MTDKEKLKKLKKLADAMYYAAQYLTTDASRLHKAMDEYRQFIIHELREESVSEQNLSNVEGTLKNWKEPVSEDLEAAAIEICSKVLKGETITIDGYECVVLSDAEECFKAGAEWQKRKDSASVSEDLEEASKEWLRPQLDKSYADYGEIKMMELTRFDGYAMLDAIEFGAKLKEQQMMAKAIDGYVIEDIEEGCGDFLLSAEYLPKSMGLKDQQRVKVIVIKKN
jgi:hypothetical protein